MSKAARVKFSVENLTQVVSPAATGISFVSGQSVRGPFADPVDIINSWPKFVDIYGGLSDVSNAPLLVRRILEKGGNIRFSRVGHYTDPTDESTLDAVLATPSPLILFEIDAPFIIDNDIDMTINGVDITTVSFDTDSNTTFNNLAAQIKTSAFVVDAYVIDNGGDATDMYIVPAEGVTLSLTAITITGGVSQAVDSQTDITSIVDNDGQTLFSLVLKNAGVDGNNFNITLGEASNGGVNYFKITLSHQTEDIVEIYDNLIITGNPTAGESTYLKNIVEGSSYINVTYGNLSNFVGQLVPIKPISFSYITGSDGTTPVDADYIGDSAAKNGLHAFDAYDDAYEMIALDNSSDAVNVAGASYATNREDLQYVVHLPISLKTTTALIAKRDELGINTKFAYLVSGGITIFDPITSQKIDITEAADVVALASKSAQDFGPWYSFAGLNRGVLQGVLGVTNNFGTPATYDDLNNLAAKQINMTITKNGQTVLWGNHSSQLADDQEKFNNVVRLVIYLRKTLIPLLETFLEEPNDIPTWRRIFYTAQPFMNGLVDKRAMYSYEWHGDQDASSLDNLTINNAADVSNGIYKIQLLIGAIPGMNEIDLKLTLTRAGATFAEVSQLT